MPSPVRYPPLALVGLGVIALLCVQLLRNGITLEVAAQRAALTVVVLAVVDRVAVPLGRAMLASGRKAPATEAETMDDGGMAATNGGDGRVS